MALVLLSAYGFDRYLNDRWVTVIWTGAWSVPAYGALWIAFRHRGELRIPAPLLAFTAVALLFAHFEIQYTTFYYLFPGVVLLAMLSCIRAFRMEGFHLRSLWPRERDIERLIRENDVDPFRMDERP